MREGSIYLLLTTTIISALLVFGIRWYLERLKNRTDLDIERKSSLLTDDEKTFFQTLQAAIGSQTRIFSKVRLLDVIRIESRMLTRSQKNQLRRISRRGLDFLLCSPGSLTPVLAINLDHRRSRARKLHPYPDELAQFTLENIGLPLLTVPCRKAYDANALGQRIRLAIAGSATTLPDIATDIVNTPAAGKVVNPAAREALDTNPNIVLEKTRKLVSGLVSSITELQKGSR